MRKKASSPGVETSEKKLTNKDKIKTIIKRPPKSKFLTESQEKYWDILDKNEITFCTGAAGTVKIHIALKKAIDLLFGDSKYEKIIIVRPPVEVGKSIGSLPGGLDEKLYAFIAPVYYLLDKIVGKEAAQELKDGGFISILSLNHIRGWSIDNTILICEESQNMSKEEMKTLLTRIGFNSKYFVSGDVEQTDLFKDYTKSGLYDAKERFAGMKNIGIHNFSVEDVVRNPIITEILKRYNT